MTPRDIESRVCLSVCIRQLIASLSAESPPTIMIVLYPLLISILTRRSTLSVFSLCTKSNSILRSSRARCNLAQYLRGLLMSCLGQNKMPHLDDSTAIIFQFPLCFLPYCSLHQPNVW